MMRTVVVVATTVLIAGCGAGAPPASAQPPASASAATTASPTVRSPQPSVATGPPSASLAAEGGDAVPGALGSWTWGETGEDSPYLPGMPLLVGAGEPLMVAFGPDRPVTRWQARYVPAGQSDAAGARLAGSGVGRPVFSAPPPGRWTLEIAVTFVGQGRTASYFWALSVT